MIVYEPFWRTLKAKKISTYYLIYKCNISSSTIGRIRKGQPLTTTTINDLCRILNCRIEEIAQYVPSDADQTL